MTSANILKHFSIQTLEELQSFAKAVAKEIQKGDTVFLSGNLGAGKTTFAKFLCVNLGVTDQVVSPTYTISKEYAGENMLVLHIDLYRLISDKVSVDYNYIYTQLENSFYKEILEEGIAIVEWGESIANQTIPRIEIKIVRNVDETRAITMETVR